MGAPKKGEDGMWYVGDTSFMTEKSAAEYHAALKSGRRQIIGAAAPVVFTVVVLVAGWWWLSRPSDTHLVGREFASMQDCLSFIEQDMGESLRVITDNPTKVAGKGGDSDLFFNCTLEYTGTRGPVLIGKWQRHK